MVEYKDFLANVAFGGGWTENLIELEKVNQVMNVLRDAANECADKDVRTTELDEALDYVKSNVEKGNMLVTGFKKALSEINPDIRKNAVANYVDLIRDWAGM